MRVLKNSLNLLALLLALPAAAVYWLGAAICGPLRIFPGWSQTYSLLPGMSGAFLRRAFYRLVLPRCGTGSFISFGTVLSHPGAELGDSIYVGPYCCLGDVILEDDVLVGSRVSITNGSRQHGIERLDIPVREQPGEWPRITIGLDSWIGDGAVVMANVGRHCVVGAGSIVTRAIPDYAIVVGSPARVIGWRNRGLAPENTNDAAACQSAAMEPV